MTQIDERAVAIREAARTRRRGKELEAAIFAATLTELAQVGYPALTMEGIASRARTGKAALYRRWPNKDELVIEAINARSDIPETLPDTGSLRGDLIALLQAVVTFMTSDAGRAMSGLLADCAGGRGPGVLDPEMSPGVVLKHRIVAPRQEMALDVLRRWAERGQVRPDAVTLSCVEVGPAMIHSRFVGLGTSVTEDDLATIVDEILIPLLRA